MPLAVENHFQLGENKSLRIYDRREYNHMIIKQICFIMDDRTTATRTVQPYDARLPSKNTALDILFRIVFGDRFFCRL